MKSGGEVGCQPFCSSGMVEGDLHIVEVPNGPRRSKVHGAELANELLHILNGYTPLAIGYLQKVYEI